MGRPARARPDKKLRDLSKGGYARVGLALALAPDPEVLLLDEPTSGLDLLTRREFLASLVELAASGRTILISSHSIAELEKACTHVGLLRDGKMILSTTLEELRKKVRRLSLRFADRAPDAAALGTVLERNGTGRFWQVMVQDPDPDAIAALPDRAGRVRLRGRAGHAGRSVRGVDGSFRERHTGIPMVKRKSSTINRGARPMRRSAES